MFFLIALISFLGLESIAVYLYLHSFLTGILLFGQVLICLPFLPLAVLADIKNKKETDEFLAQIQRRQDRSAREYQRSLDILAEQRYWNNREEDDEDPCFDP